MLLDLSRTKIRAPMQWFQTPAEPTRLFQYEPERLVVLFYIAQQSPGYLTVARRLGDLTSVDTNIFGYNLPIEIYGPEEIWVTGGPGNSELIGAWQAIYRG